MKWLAVVFGVFSSASLAVAQTLVIDHEALGCAVAQKFPRLEARFTPADAVATARVVFQGENPQEWYWVVMKPDGAAFSGVLPSPKKSLKAFRYYIEVTGRTLGTNRTADYTTMVVESASECKRGVVAATVGSATVLIEGPVGAAVLPAGFASAGVVAGSAAGAATAAAGGGGGLSGGAVAGIVAGAGAAVAGVAVAAGKGGDASSGGSSSASSGTVYAGPLNGQMTLTETATGTGGVTSVCSSVRSIGGTITVTLQQASGTVSGQAMASAMEAVISRTPTCNGDGPGGVGAIAFSCAVTGSSASLGCMEQRTSSSAPGFSETVAFAFSGALSGGVISGTVTYGRSGSGTPQGTASFTSSTTFPVTLR